MLDKVSFSMVHEIKEEAIRVNELAKARSLSILAQAMKV
jgi:hypothetical protein